jgi:hypothetical protein
MDPEGMVHALEEIRRLLKSDGVLINILPASEGSLIKALQGGKILFAERRCEICDDDELHAEDAVTQVVEQDLFVVDRSAEFDFLRYASSVRELRACWEEEWAYDDSPRKEAEVAREEYLFAQVEEIMQTSGAGSEAAIHSKARITRLKPVS